MLTAAMNRADRGVSQWRLLILPAENAMVLSPWSRVQPEFPYRPGMASLSRPFCPLFPPRRDPLNGRAGFLVYPEPRAADWLDWGERARCAPSGADGPRSPGFPESRTLEPGEGLFP